jgi:hypothetical protein
MTTNEMDLDKFKTELHGDNPEIIDGEQYALKEMERIYTEVFNGFDRVLDDVNLRMQKGDTMMRFHPMVIKIIQAYLYTYNNRFLDNYERMLAEKLSNFQNEEE